MKFAPYSKSRLDASDCPWAFANEYIGRSMDTLGKKRTEEKFADFKYRLVPRPPKDQVNLIFGKVVHNILEEILNEWVEGKDFTADDVVEVINKHMDPALLHGPEGFNYLNVQSIIDRFMKWGKSSYDLKMVAGCEIELGIKFDGTPCEYTDPDCFARMIADVLELYPKDGVARLTDHKSQLNIASAEDNFQLALYVYIIFMNYRMIDKVVARLHFCRYGRYEEIEYTREDILRVKAAVMAKVRNIESRHNLLSAKRCTYCTICRYRTTTCPMIKNEARRKIRTPTSNNEAQMLFEKLIGLNVQVDEIKKILKDWCALNAAAVSVPHDLDPNKPENKCSDAMCIGFKTNEEKRYRTNEVEALFREYDIDFKPYLLTSSTELGKILNTKKRLKELFNGDLEKGFEFRERLEKIQIKTPKVSFRQYKVNLNKPEKL